MPDRPYLDVGQRLESIRLEARQTKRAFAKSLDLNDVTYGRYESGQRLDIDVICNISKLHGVSLDWLLLGLEPKQRPAHQNRDGEVSCAEDVMPYLRQLNKEEMLRVIQLLVVQILKQTGD